MPQVQFDERTIFRRGRPSRFGAMADASWLPQELPAGFDHIEPQGFVTNVNNRPAGTGDATVVIDASGITIEDGSLIIRDIYGETVAEAGGFTGGWRDQVMTGVRNGYMKSNTTGSNIGETPDVPEGDIYTPYWLRDIVSGTPTFNSDGGGGSSGYLEVSNLDAGYSAQLSTQSVRLRPGVQYIIAINDKSASVVIRDVTLKIRGSDGVSNNVFVDLSVGQPVFDTAEVFRTPPLRIDEVTDGFVDIIITVTSSDADAVYQLFGVSVVPIVLNIGGAEADMPPYDADLDGTPGVYMEPREGDIWFNTDLSEWFRYELAPNHWLGTQLHHMPVPLNVTTTVAITATANARWMVSHPTGDSKVWVESVSAGFHVASGGTALGASHKWVGTLSTNPGGGALGILTIASGSSNVWRTVSDTAGAGVWDGASEFSAYMSWVKTGTPGNLTPPAAIIHYRHYIAGA